VKKTTAKGWLQLAASVDWPRQLQRAGVLLRQLRGDERDSIQADHDTEMQRGEGLHRTITETMRRAVGCVAPKPCTCSYCDETTA
jgi:hypothetical protein